MEISTHKSQKKTQKKLETELMLAVVTRAESPGSGGAEPPARPEYPVLVGRSLRPWGGDSGLLQMTLMLEQVSTADNTGKSTNRQKLTWFLVQICRKRPRENLEIVEPLSAMMESTRWGEDPQSVGDEGGAADAADPGAWRRLL